MHAERFDRPRFMTAVREYVARRWAESRDVASAPC
jgi:hypothetical protein